MGKEKVKNGRKSSSQYSEREMTAIGIGLKHHDIRERGDKQNINSKKAK